MAKKLKAVHPGEILREDYLKLLKLSMNKLAMDLRVPVTRIADIVARRAKGEILVHDLAHRQIGSIPTTPRPSSTIGRELVARYVTEKMTAAN